MEKKKLFPGGENLEAKKKIPMENYKKKKTKGRAICLSVHQSRFFPGEFRPK